MNTFADLKMVPAHAAVCTELTPDDIY